MTATYGGTVPRPMDLRTAIQAVGDHVYVIDGVRMDLAGDRVQWAGVCYETRDVMYRVTWDSTGRRLFTQWLRRAGGPPVNVERLPADAGGRILRGVVADLESGRA